MRLIDADELIKSCQDEKGVYFSYEAAVSANTVDKAPTVDAVPVRHGRWNNGYEVQNCSECGYRGKRSYKYCPNCGAKMDGGETP